MTQAQEPAADVTRTAANEVIEPAAAEPGIEVAAPAAPSKRVVDYDNPTIEDILDAWKERERKVKSFKFEWSSITESHTDYKRRPNRTQEWKRVSPPNVYHQFGRTLALQGRGIAVAYPGGSNTPEDKSTTLNWYRSNGTEMGYAFWVNIEPRHVQAQIKTVTEPPYFDGGFNAPLFYLYRPLYPLTYDYTSIEDNSSLRKPVEFTLLPPKDSDDKTLRLQLKLGVRRVVLTLRRAEGFPFESLSSYWDNEYTPADAPPSMTITVELEPHDVCGWIPRKWNTVHTFVHNRLPESEDEATVTSVSINEPLDESLFDPSNLPVGTLVIDEQSPGVELNYFIKENGEHEPVIDPNQPAPRRKR